MYEAASCSISTTKVATRLLWLDACVRRWRWRKGNIQNVRSIERIRVKMISKSVPYKWRLVYTSTENEKINALYATISPARQELLTFRFSLGASVSLFETTFGSNRIGQIVKLEASCFGIRIHTLTETLMSSSCVSLATFTNRFYAWLSLIPQLFEKPISGPRPNANNFESFHRVGRNFGLKLLVVAQMFETKLQPFCVDARFHRHSAWCVAFLYDPIRI